MSNLIANRYRLQIELPAVDLCDAWLAEDSVAGSEEYVQVYVANGPRASDLIHNIIERRATELTRLNLPAYVPMIDYGYDGKNSCYYFVYSYPSGSPLDKYIPAASPSFAWSCDLLIPLAEFLTDLHVRGISHGFLESHEIVVAPEGRHPRVMCTGLATLVSLVRGDLTGADDFEELFSDDRLAFLSIMEQFLCQSAEPTRGAFDKAIDRLPKKIGDLIKSLYPLLKDSHSAGFPEAKRILEQVRREIEKEKVFYLSLTDRATRQLHEMRFIPEPRDYLGIAFLRQELGRGVYAWAQDSRDGEGRAYRLTTSQLRLWCAPDRRSKPPGHLAITGIDVREPSELAQDRENGLRIDATLEVESLHRIPRNTDVTPLLNTIEAHVSALEQVRKRDLRNKDRLEVWERLLDTQRRLLRAFRLPYTDWEVAGDRATIELHLAEAPNENEVDLTADDVLCLTRGSDGKQLPCGYFEDLTGDVLRIGLARNVDLEQVKKSGLVTVDNAQAEAVLSRQQRALKRLRFHETANPNLPAILADPDQLDIDRPVAIDMWFQNHLDTSQYKAVRRALATRDVFLIQGPPGTGKTSVIAELVLQIIERQERARIMVTSQSNVAVNHALDKIRELRPDLSEYVVRVGREDKVGSTEELLLDRQLQVWRNRVIQRSNNYLAGLERQTAGGKGLTDALGVLEECKNLSLVRQERADELARVAQKLAEVEAEYDQLERDLNRTTQLRQHAEGVLADASPGDERLRGLLQSFQREYLDWAGDFLKQANLVAGIGFQREELLRKKSGIEEEIGRLDEESNAGRVLVNEFLQSEFGASFKTHDEQQAFIADRYAGRQEEMARLGRIRRLVKEWQLQVGQSYDDFASAYLGRCKVVGATCIGVAAKGYVSDMEFDWVIVDEAGRATPPELLVPIVRGRRIVLVGDHRQLPPIIGRDLDEAIRGAGDVRRDVLEVSLFQELIERVADKLVQLPLTIQYRMHPAIGTLIGECFYADVGLENGVDEEERQHGLSWAKRPVIWYSTKRLSNHRDVQSGYSRQNQAEVDAIVALLDRIETSYAEAGIWDRTVGVITGYLAQKAALRQKILARQERWSHLKEVEVDTVDAYQGRERDIIIYSVVRSNPEGKIGFLRDERRLNVALSRARQLLIIVGDEDVEFANVQGSNPFNTVIRHIRSHQDECTLEAL
jgi:hypothetical protein